MGAFFPDQMDEYCYYYNANNSKRTQVVPPFGNWDNYDDHNHDTAAFPFTQCFETAGHNYQYHHPPPSQDAGYDLYDYGKINNNRRRVHSFEDDDEEEEKDLYVAGDLYQNDVFTPAVIVVPRRRPRTTTKRGNPLQKPNNNNKKKHHHQQNWAAGQDLVLKQPPVNTNSPPRRSSRRSKDEDLYKIPSHLLHSAPKRKRGFGLFSSCMLPACV